MNASRSSSGRDEFVEPNLPRALGAAQLAADLVACLLAQPGEVVLERCPRRHANDRADVLALDVEGPPLGDLARTERCGQGVCRGVPTAHATQVDHVPRGGVRIVAGRRRGEMVGESIGHGGQVARVCEHGRVISVVGRPEEDGLRRRLDRGELEAGSRPHRRSGQRVARLDLMTVHERRDRDRLRARWLTGIDDDQRLLVGVLAVCIPPRPMEGPLREGRRPWVPFGEAVPRCFGDGVERPVLGAQRASRGGFGGRSVHGTRTGGLRGERGGGHFGRG